MIFLVSTNRLEDPYPVYPLGMACVAAQLEAAGMTVEVGDRLVDEEDALIARIAEARPRMVGLSFRNLHIFSERSLYDTLADLREFVDRVRAVTEAPVVVGGSAVHIQPLPVVRGVGADFGIVGDGRDLVRLIHDIEAGGAGRGLPGVVRPEDETFDPPPRQGFEPDVATTLLPPRYVEYYDRYGGMLNLQSRVGCTFRCSYCSYPVVEGRTLRVKPIDRLLREVELIREGGGRYFFVVDSVFNAGIEDSMAFARGLIERRLDMRWMAYMSPLGFPEGYLELLAEAGLGHVEFGSDSLSGAMLRVYRKPFGVEQVIRSSRQVMDAGVRLAHFFVLGGPGETEATLAATLSRSMELAGDAFFYMPGVTLYAGTPLADRLGRGKGGLDPDDPLRPVIALEEGFSSDGIHRIVSAHAKTDARWITPERIAEGEIVAARIRKRGRIKGPLWEFLGLSKPGDPR